MHQPRIIQAADAEKWLGVFFNHALSNRSNLELDALLEILEIGYKAAHHPGEMPNRRVVQLLLEWSYRHVDSENWERLSSSVYPWWEYNSDSQEKP